MMGYRREMQVCACEILEFQLNDTSYNNVMTARVSGPYLVI